MNGQHLRALILAEYLMLFGLSCFVVVTSSVVKNKFIFSFI